MVVSSLSDVYALAVRNMAITSILMKELITGLFMKASTETIYNVE